VTALSGSRRRLALSSRVVRAVLQSPALRRVEVAFLLFTAVEYGTWIAILLFAYRATGPTSIGVVALVQLVPAALVVPFASSLADRFDRGNVLVAGYLVQALAYGATALGILVGAPAVVVYACAAGAATALSVTRPTQGSLLPTLSRTPEELTAANGISGTVEGIGLLLGPLAAAAILTIGTPGYVFVAGAAATILAAALVTRLPRPEPAGRADEPAVRDGMHSHDQGPSHDHSPSHDHPGLMAGLQAITRNGDTRLVVAVLGLRMVVSGALDILFVLLALDVLRTGDPGAGVLNAALGGGTVLGGAATFALVGRQRLAPALAISAATVGGALLLVGASSSAVAPVLVGAAGVGYAACDVIGRTILQRVTPDEVLARVLGALEGVGLAGLALGSLAVPLLVAADGIPLALVVVALLLPIGIAVGWQGLARIDRQVLVPLRAIALLRAVVVFAPLPAPQLEWVARRARWMTVETGTMIIREGDVGEAYYALESGRVRVTQDAKTLRISEGYGIGFGEIALLHDVLRTATVTALEPCVLLTLDRTDFLEAVTGHERARSIVERVAAERLQEQP
jgi:MFS family permease